jgi:type II secretory pathway pseudopilin PulG
MLFVVVAQMWRKIAPGITSFTKAAGYAMTLSLRNATVYMRPQGQSLAAISTEPAAAPGSITVQGQNAESSSSGGLSGGAIAGIVVGSIAVIALLAAVAAFGFLRLRRRRQQEAADQQAADRKLGGVIAKAVHGHPPNGGSSGSTGRSASVTQQAAPQVLCWLEHIVQQSGRPVTRAAECMLTARDTKAAAQHASYVCSCSDGWRASVRSASDAPSSSGSIAILPADVEICLHPDGRPWVLGAGNFGKARVAHLSF